jgi:hypothetical protein
MPSPDEEPTDHDDGLPGEQPEHEAGMPRPKKRRSAPGKAAARPVSKKDKILRVERRTTTVAGEGEMVMLPSLAAPAWEFIHPRCARRRHEDIEEVEAMVEAGETEIAREELVWLLSECPDFLEAHLQLGLLALEEDDPKLARGHFGRAVELGFRAIEAAGNPRPFPATLPGNRAFFESAKGLVCALVESGRTGMAIDTAKKVAALDPADPLGLVRLASAGKGGKRG